jgi:hypothetical protein
MRVDDASRIWWMYRMIAEMENMNDGMASYN